MATDKISLAGDIGGTKTALALVSESAGPRKPLAQATFRSSMYASLESIVQEFLKGKNVQVDNASFGVAGPVVGNIAHITNLPWVIDAAVLSQTLGGAPAHLLNDLEAMAHSVPFLDATDLDTLSTGKPQEHGALAVVAPGTGLGEAFLIWCGDRYLPCPSEGGHSDFAPAQPIEVELLSFLLQRFGHVSYERVCSGLGLPNLYEFLKESGKAAEPDWLRERLAEAPDPTPVIVQAAQEGEADIAVQALQLFVSILGGEAGNMALKVLATGGVYLGGGIPPRIVPWLRQPSFLEAFGSKGRLSEVLVNTPVHVIRRPDAALFGSSCHALGLV